jgi:hypothetical protein
VPSVQPADAHGAAGGQAGASGAGLAVAGARPGTPVYCEDERSPVGRVEAWVATAEHGRQLLVRTGWWDPVIRRIPISDVESSGPGGVRLALQRWQLLQRPLYLTDRELERAVHLSLMTFPPLRYTAVHTIDIEARDGFVRITGHVANELHRREALKRAATAPGVARVETGLVSDEWLLQAVAREMLPYAELQPSRVRIGAHMGFVTLEGELDSPRDIELANAIVAEVRGVVSVESRLRVRQPAMVLARRWPDGRVVLIVPGEAWPPWREAPEPLPLGHVHD